jgi:hypothetical protein
MITSKRLLPHTSIAGLSHPFSLANLPQSHSAQRIPIQGNPSRLKPAAHIEQVRCGLYSKTRRLAVAGGCGPHLSRHINRNRNRGAKSTASSYQPRQSGWSHADLILKVPWSKAQRSRGAPTRFRFPIEPLRPLAATALGERAHTCTSGSLSWHRPPGPSRHELRFHMGECHLRVMSHLLLRGGCSCRNEHTKAPIEQLYSAHS